MMKKIPKQTGFTLIELMVTMTVMAILLTVGVPSYQSHMKDNRRITAINELVSAMHLARSEATKSNSTVAFCPSADRATCSGGTYDSGWIVFINSDGDTPPGVDSGETILRTDAGVMRAGTSLRASGGIAAGVNILATGRPNVFGGITYCDDRGSGHARSVTLNLVGVINASSDSSGLTCP